MTRFYLFALGIVTLLIFTGCSVAVPVHEAEPPEVLDNWGFRVALLEGTSPQIATTDSGVTSTPSGSTDTLEGFRLGFGFLHKFQLNSDFYAGGSSSGSSFALKYQWTGDTYFNAAGGNYVQTTVLRTWSGSGAGLSLYYDGSTNLADDSTLKATGWDLSHFWGYRPTSYFGFYGGPKVMLGDVSAQYKNSDSGTILATASRSFWGAGGLGGLYLSPHSQHIGFDFNLEMELMNLPQTYESGRNWYTTMMITFGLPFSFD